MAKIKVDNKEYEVEDGKNLLDACLGLGLDLPYFCWHPSMGSVGSCRQCAVKVYQDENDTRGRVLMGCMTPVADGMRIGLDEKTVSDFRDKCIEVTMANHPHDCPVCEEGGECHLQDVTIMSNHTERRYRGEKKTYENQYLGPCIGHEMNRCITCYRCVRFYNDYAGGKDLAAMASRENTYFGRHEEGCLESVFSGNLVEVCPTGVFTDKTLARSYNRKWDLQTAPSICHGCSLGCNIAPAERQGKIKRITNRYHGEINGYFICDKGRFAYDHVNADSRLRECRVDNEVVSYLSAIEGASDHMRQVGLEKCFGIASEKASFEENILLKKLVGENNFCSGMSVSRQNMLSEILKIYRNPAIEIASLKSIEACDAVIILGEDLVNSAARMALSVRQATRNVSFEMADAARIPLWQDASVRTLAQTQRSPLIIASVAGTELDEIASEVVRVSPAEIAQFGFAVANAINDKFPKPDVGNVLGEQAVNAAEKLLGAKNPLVISGCSLNSLDIIKAAAQVSSALSSKRSNGSRLASKTAFVLPDANSLGLALLFDDKTMSIEDLVQGVDTDSAILQLQNDVYRHVPQATADNLLNTCRATISLSQLENSSTRKSNVVIPAASFVETEGTIVNNEGRAQRYFEVFAGENDAPRDNWLSLVNLARAIQSEEENESGRSDIADIADIQTFDDISSLIQADAPFSAWADIAPSADFRIAGMKMPRQPHRYSGRTSQKANIDVSEVKAPVDSDSALGFTMEGSPINRPPALNAQTWSPGWNSNEAINKFQDEIAGSLKGGDPGLLLLNTKRGGDLHYDLPAAVDMTLTAVSQSRLFDGCESSVLSAALAQRAEPRVAFVNPETAHTYKLSDGDLLKISVNTSAVSLPVVIDNAVPNSIVIVPDDVHTRAELPAAILPAVCQIVGVGHD